MSLRQTNIDKLQHQPLDVLIVGAGINGAVAANALAAHGVNVGLVDQGDFGGFTSQQSSNLIWGGIKYLETAEFNLVRKLCKSRNELIEAFPANVKEIRFLTTIAKQFRWPRSLLYIGSWLYWLIGRSFTKMPEILDARAINSRAPEVRTEDSQGGFEYSDAYLIDNDARFVFHFVRSAMDFGAAAVNYTELRSMTQRPDGLWHGCLLNKLTGQEISVTSRMVINCTGPFVDSLNEQLGVSTHFNHIFSKGIHLTVPRIHEHNRVLAFFANDGRLFFVIPMGPVSCIGTTDTRVTTQYPSVTQKDRLFILANVNQMLNLKRPLDESDIIAERCGVRPLVKTRNRVVKDAQDWTAMSRKHEVEYDSDKCFISIYGGKLTDCLNIGREVLAIYKSSGRLPMPIHNNWYGEPPREASEEFFEQARLWGLDKLTAPESSEPLSIRLWRRYGMRAFTLLDEIRENTANAEVLITGTEYIRCELKHAARCEMVCFLDDFLRRRSKISLIARSSQIKKARGLEEAAEILFGPDSTAQIEQYFS